MLALGREDFHALVEEFPKAYKALRYVAIWRRARRILITEGRKEIDRLQSARREEGPCVEGAPAGFE